MTVSGILVICRPESVADVEADVARFSWADVHYTDPNGRLVVTVEASSTDEGIERTLTIQKLPRVISAEMVEHFVGDEPTPQSDTEGGKA